MENEMKTTRRGLRLETDREELAVQLKMYRLRQGLTQGQLGNAWGCSRYTIMRLEKAKETSWEMMYKIFNNLAVALANENRQL